MFTSPNRVLGRREFVTLIAGCVIDRPLVSHAQQAAPAPKRIAILSGLDCSGPERWWSNRMTELVELAGLARDGLLAAYGQDFVRDFIQATENVDKILRGTKPSELPVVQATNLQLVINLKTAKGLGLTVPSSLLASAGEVIE